MKAFLLIDDHEILRTAVKNILIDQYGPCVIAEAHDETSVIRELQHQPFDMVIMDVQIPNTDTSRLFEYIKNNYHNSKVIFFSMSDEKIYAKKFLNAGASGFISKNSEIKELERAIHLILNGRKYTSETMLDETADKIGQRNTTINPFSSLSPREIDIASLLLKGISVGEIAALLKISNSTVGTLKSRIFNKLKVTKITELIEMGRVYNILH